MTVPTSIDGAEESKRNISRCFRFYFTSEQLLEPTGSLRQVDMAITADSIAVSSPY